MEEENIRSRGVVVRFNEQKGYGFIKLNDGGDDLFVHHTEIKSDGYRTLYEDQTVKFLVGLNNNKTMLTLPLLTRFATVAAAAALGVGLVMALAVAEEGGMVSLEEVVVASTTVGCKGILLENALTIHEKSDHLVVETSQEVTDVPYGDYFRVEGLWDVERDGDESEHCCILREYVNVAFSKKIMWKGAVTGAITTPLDVIKTRLMIQVSNIQDSNGTDIKRSRCLLFDIPSSLYTNDRQSKCSCSYFCFCSNCNVSK